MARMSLTRRMARLRVIIPRTIGRMGEQMRAKIKARIARMMGENEGGNRGEE